MKNKELEFYDAIKSYFLKRVGSIDVAEDLTQDVFLKLTKMDSLENIRSFRFWVFTVAKNTLFDYYRKTKPSEEYDDNRHSSDYDGNDYNDISDCIISMMSKLSAEDEELLKKVDLNEISQKELSSKMGIDYTTLKSKVQRARKKLHKKLIDCCQFNKDRTGAVSFCKKNTSDEVYK